MLKRTISIGVVYGALVAMSFGQNQGAYSEIFSEPEIMSDAVAASGAFDRGAGFLFGPLRILPELSVSYVHDSNPTYVPNGAKAINSIQVKPQVDLLLKGNGWNAFGNAWMTHDWLLGDVDPAYRDTVAQAHYGETLGFQLESARGSRLTLTESYEYLNYQDIVGTAAANDSWQDRYLLVLGAQFDTPLGEHTGMNLGAKYTDLWYDNPLQAGWQDAGVSLGFSRHLTPKSDLLLSFGYDNQWSDGSNGESRCYRALVGLGTHPSAKTSVRAEVGIMEYSFDNGADTAVSWTYNLLGNWRIARRLSANVSGTANFLPSEYTDQINYTLEQVVSAGLTFEATTRLTTSLNAFYRREAYAKVDAVADEKRIDNQVGLSARANYRLFRYTSVFAGVDYGKNTSTIADYDYRRTILQSGVNIQF